MGYLIFLAIALVLFVGFLALTRIEAHRGARMFAPARAAFDGKVSRASFALAHVDFAAFLRDGLRALAARLAHDLAHGTLIVVRSIERFLTRTVRALRAHRAPGVPESLPNAPTNFVANLNDFKQELRNGRAPSGEEQMPG